MDVHFKKIAFNGDLNDDTVAVVVLEYIGWESEDGLMDFTKAHDVWMHTGLIELNNCGWAAKVYSVGDKIVVDVFDHGRLVASDNDLAKMVLADNIAPEPAVVRENDFYDYKEE